MIAVWHGDQRRISAQCVGCSCREFGIEAQSVAYLLPFIDQRSSQNRGSERVQPVCDPCNYAEIAAASAQTPEQVGVLMFGGVQHSPIRRDYLGRQHVVAGESVLAAEPTDASTKR